VGQAWDKVGTRDKRDTKSFFKNREKSMKIGCKWLHVHHLRFSRSHEKRVKNANTLRGLSEPPASAGGQFLDIKFRDFCVFRGQTFPVS
jgi:hypothetical protein